MVKEKKRCVLSRANVWGPGSMGIARREAKDQIINMEKERESTFNFLCFPTFGKGQEIMIQINKHCKQ